MPWSSTMEKSDAIHSGFSATPVGCCRRGQRGRAPWGRASDSTKHGHAPGGSWKRPTTLFSGVLKKAAAIELYSPSAQKSCKVGREDGPVGWDSPGQHQCQPHGRMRSGCCVGGRQAMFQGSIHTAPTSEILCSPCQAAVPGGGLGETAARQNTSFPGTQQAA